MLAATTAALFIASEQAPHSLSPPRFYHSAAAALALKGVSPAAAGRLSLFPTHLSGCVHENIIKSPPVIWVVIRTVEKYLETNIFDMLNV
jgi:hypothetical protein